MKSFSRKHPHKAPVSPETDKPFFRGDRTSDSPFFHTSNPTPVQPKLTIGKSNDVYEQEADAMAESVVSHSNTTKPQIQSQGQIHRQTIEEEEPAQAKPELMRAEEQEDDMQAKPELMRMEEKEEPAQAKPELMRMEEEEELAQAKPELMRMEEEEEPVQAKPELMRMEEEEEPVQAKAEAGQAAQSNLSQRLENTKGQGQPLPAKTQQQMAHAFNYDFSDVTIHTGVEAVKMTRELHAQAFTHGNDIYFNEGKYNPDSSTGQELLAHELTHVVQQKPAD